MWMIILNLHLICPLEKIIPTQWIAGCMDPVDGLDTSQKKIPLAFLESGKNSSLVQAVVIVYWLRNPDSTYNM
jgi:hypothetical protein